MKTIFCILLFCGQLIWAQHAVPFDSKNNCIELSVANASMEMAEDVTVEVAAVPRWVKFINGTSQISNLAPGTAQTASFIFSIDKSAPVNKPEQAVLTIKNSNGEKWTKTLSLQVSPPERFEVMQNYPNPFNPATTISYLLPMATETSVKIFDVTGREVTTVFSGIEDAGYHQHEWRAMSVASGMYIYQIVIKNEKGKNEYHRKKMLLMK